VGFVAQIWSAPTPQGFAYRQYGKGRYGLVDFEGLALVTRTPKGKGKGRGGEQML
jgi:hypothetical protein